MRALESHKTLGPLSIESAWKLASLIKRMCLNENEARGALSSIFGHPGAFTFWHFLGQSMISMAAHKPF